MTDETPGRRGRSRPVTVRLHHDREPGPVDAAPALEDLGQGQAERGVVIASSRPAALVGINLGQCPLRYL